MLAFKIDEKDIKLFMKQLLIGDEFDEFDFREVSIVSVARFEVSSADADKKSWSIIKNYIFNIIKGSEKPKSMRFVFSVPVGKVEEISKNTKAMFLNIQFEGETILLTTGVSQKIFSLDKSSEEACDNFIQQFLKSKKIPVF